MKKAIYLVFVFIFSTTLVFADNNTAGILGGSIGVGTIIAIVASWSRNQSVLWAILHAILGWFYVIYFVFSRK